MAKVLNQYQTYKIHTILINMPIRMLTTETRKKVEEIIRRIGNGNNVSLDERIQLRKYAIRIPFVAGKLAQALRKRESLDKDGLL